MKISKILMVISFLALTRLAGQGTRADEVYRTIPGEAVYVQHNTNLLFSGETLYYKLYCMNPASGKPSALSKIAYVAMVGKDRQTVFQHKLRLENGMGQGEFFVPANVSTGSYKLIAYTNWMKNGQGNPVFTADVVLVNPYQDTSENYLEKPVPDSLVTDSLEVLNEKQPAPPVEHEPDAGQLTATLDKSQFGKRALVRLDLQAGNETVAGGYYSLSVRRLSDLGHPSEPEPAPIRMATATFGDTGQGTPVLPEMRGELLSGKVQAPEEGMPVNNLPVAFSITGDDFIFEIARTNEQGTFYFNLDRDYDTTKGIFQVLDQEGKGYDIRMDEETVPIPESLNFYEFSLNDELADEIRTRSIQNQIENAYVEVKADTLIQPRRVLPFYRDFQLRYHLDDFTRFNTIEETLVEIVDHVWLSQDRQGQPMFQVRPLDGYLDGIGMPPMVFMDGLYIQNHKDILGFPARQIKNIFISRDRYQIGANVFQGILAFETFASDFSDNFYRDFLKAKPLFRPQTSKAYYFQSYDNSGKQERIPDFRRQLYWVPNLSLSGGKKQVHWFTSDLAGTYEVNLQGFTSEGQPISLVKLFNVE